MKQDEIQKIILELIPTFLKAGEESIDLFNKKLKINTSLCLWVSDTKPQL